MGERYGFNAAPRRSVGSAPSIRPSGSSAGARLVLAREPDALDFEGSLPRASPNVDATSGVPALPERRSLEALDDEVWLDFDA